VKTRAGHTTHGCDSLLKFSIVMHTRSPAVTISGEGFGSNDALMGGTVHEILRMPSLSITKTTETKGEEGRGGEGEGG
jgi:hypothetical protein